MAAASVCGVFADVVGPRDAGGLEDNADLAGDVGPRGDDLATGGAGGSSRSSGVLPSRVGVKAPKSWQTSAKLRRKTAAPDATTASAV